MNLLVRLRDKTQSTELFSACIYSNRFRVLPSIYRHPFLSIRWLWFTFTWSGLFRLPQSPDRSLTKKGRMSFGDGLAGTTRQLIEQVSKEKERIIVEQLNDLLARGLLVWEQGPETFVQAHDLRDGFKIEFRTSGRLVLKDREYIEKLEKENGHYSRK